MNPPLSLAVAAFALLLAVVLGRGLERHTVNRPHVPMVATSLCAGLGLWTLLWLAFVPLGGGHTVLLAPLVLLVTLALAGNHLRRWARDKAAEEHYWSLPIVHTLLLAWWLPLLWVAGPATLADFENLHTLTTLAQHGGWPTGGEQPFGHGAPGWYIVHLLPATATAIAGQQVIPATMVLSFFTLLAVASLLPAMAGTHVKWSNLPLVAAPALLLTLALAPLALPLPAAAPGLLMAPLALAVAALPLLRPGQPETGWNSLPYALALAWLATVHPLAIPASVVLACVWVAVALRGQGLSAGVVLTASLLVALPVVATLLLAHALWPWQAFNLSSPQSIWNSLTTMVPWPFEGPVWVQVIHVGSLVLLALPIRIAGKLYDGSALARATYRHPWLYAMPLVAVAVAAGLALQPYAVIQPEPVIAHTQTIAADVQEKKILTPNQPVAVVGMSPLAVQALQYHLPNNPLHQVSLTAPLSSFHATARQQGYGMLWLGPQAAQSLFGLPTPPSASLLAQTTESGLLIRAIYPTPYAR